MNTGLSLFSQTGCVRVAASLPRGVLRKVGLIMTVRLKLLIALLEALNDVRHGGR